MSTVHVMTGLPSSGKTTRARTLGALRFSLDDYRAMMGAEPWGAEKEAVAIAAMVSSAREAIRAGSDVVLDNTHLTPRLPRLYRKRLGPLGVDFVVVDLTDVSVEECIGRDAGRENGVGSEAIAKMAERHAGATKTGWRLTTAWMNGDRRVDPRPYGPRPDLPAAVIVDIDGTVALHGDERGHYEYENVAGDRPNWPVVHLVRQLARECELVFVSGREDRCRRATMWWLSHHQVGPAPHRLLMRATGDHRADYIVKAELFDSAIRDVYDVRLVLDDRDQVVDMWRAMGLTCLQVADGDF